MNPLTKVQTAAEYHALVVRLRAKKRGKPKAEQILRPSRVRHARVRKGVPPHA